jgi:hypothetical protein
MEVLIAMVVAVARIVQIPGLTPGFDGLALLDAVGAVLTLPGAAVTLERRLILTAAQTTLILAVAAILTGSVDACAFFLLVARITVANGSDKHLVAPLAWKRIAIVGVNTCQTEGRFGAVVADDSGVHCINIPLEIEVLVLHEHVHALCDGWSNVAAVQLPLTYGRYEAYREVVYRNDLTVAWLNQRHGVDPILRRSIGLNTFDRNDFPAGR